MVLDPPRNIIDEIQKSLVKFFWTGQHWLKAAVLYLPVHEGGQGLIDIVSRVAVFRLQVKSSHLYLYSAFNNTNCNKALHNIKIGKLCQ